MLSKVFSKCLLAEIKLLLDKRHYITEKHLPRSVGTAPSGGEELLRMRPANCNFTALF